MKSFAAASPLLQGTAVTVARGPVPRERSVTPKTVRSPEVPGGFCHVRWRGEGQALALRAAEYSSGSPDPERGQDRPSPYGPGRAPCMSIEKQTCSVFKLQGALDI